MFRLDDVDLDFEDDDDTFSLNTVSLHSSRRSQQPASFAGAHSPVADESGDRLSFGFQANHEAASETSSTDIFETVRLSPPRRYVEERRSPPRRQMEERPPPPRRHVVERQTPPRRYMEERRSPPRRHVEESRTRSPVLRSPLRTMQTMSKRAPRSEGRKEKTTGKLPGPAGTLPKLTPNMDVNLMNHRLKTKRTSPLRPSQPPPSQASQEEDAWSVARADIGPALWPAFRRNCIAAVVAKATRRALSARGKVPCMCVQLAEIAAESVDARVQLKDASGSMKGTLHREALRCFKAHLKIGTVMVLKLVSVFSPTPKTHYLNITMPNLVQLYDATAPLLPTSVSRPRLSPDQVHAWESECAALPATPPLNRAPRSSTPLFQGPRPITPAPRGPRPPTPARNLRPPMQMPSPALSVARGFECLLDDDMDDLLASSMVDDVMGGGL